MRVAIVTGAGASAAFGQGGSRIPMMAEWSSDLRRRLGGPRADAMGLVDGADGPTFEAAIGRFVRFAASLPITSAMQWVGHPPMADGFEDRVSAWFRQADVSSKEIQAALFASLHDLFSLSRFDLDAAAQAWQLLLNAFPTERFLCAAATTNYDLSLETSLQRMRLRPESGVEVSYEPGRASSVRVDHIFGLPDRTAMMYLHGRVGWYVADGELVAQDPRAAFSPDTGVPALLLPDPDKAYTETYVVTLWQQFVEAVQSSQRVLVVGHSLNDRRLVEALRGASEVELGVTVFVPEGATTNVLEANIAGLRGLLGREAMWIPMRFGPEPEVDRSSWQRFLDGQLRNGAPFDGTLTRLAALSRA